ncbi:hypothetical protein PENTCL1PPCAC_14479, partial [Pristionchus entomophagus]
GNRTWVLLLLTLPFPIFKACCTPLFFFNSDLHILFLDPGIYSDRFLYQNMFHAVNNTIVTCFPMALYAFIFGDILRNRRNIANRNPFVNRAAFMLSVQSGFIVLIHLNTCIVYEITQYISTAEVVLYAVHIGWMLMHGLPPFIYLYFNQSIRRGVLSQILP